MVRNKRSAPAVPAAVVPSAAPLVQTVPWTPGRQKGRAPLPPSPSSSPAMPTSVSEKAAGVLPPPAGQTAARFCLGPYERRGGGGTALDAADGGSLGVDSEGSSTDVGVCLDDSASDVSQDSLVTSDSAVSSPPARRLGRRSPGSNSAGAAAPPQVISTGPETRKRAAAEESVPPQTVMAGAKTPQPVATSPATSQAAPVEAKTTQVISVNSAPVHTVPVESNTAQAVPTRPGPPHAVSVEWKSKVVSTSTELSKTVSTSPVPSQPSSVELKTPQIVSTNLVPPEATAAEQKIPEVDSVAPPPPQASSTEQASSPVSRPSTQGSSSVFLSPEQPTQAESSTAQKPSTPSPAPSPVSSPSASRGGSTSVFLSPGQPESELPLSQPSDLPLPQSSPDPQPSPKSTSPQSPQASSVIQTPQKSSAPQPPQKSPAPQPPQKPLAALSLKQSPGLEPSRKSPTLSQQQKSAAPSSPRASPVLQSPRQSPAPLRQLSAPSPPPPPPAVQTRTYSERQRQPQLNATPLPPLPEHGFQFHLKEGAPEGAQGVTVDGFAGVRDYLSPTAPIHSSRGTVRGVKDRVRAGIATFLQDNSAAKTLKDREQDRLVVYVTTMTIVRSTYQQCQRVRQILRQLMAEFEERDLFLSVAHQQELQQRLGVERVTPPQVFIDGNLLGGADAVERLNESGELRRMLRPYKVAGPRTSCGKCGGFRMLPCTACNGSKKSCHRNHFTEQWVVLRCGTCDQSGLMRCDLCRS